MLYLSTRVGNLASSRSTASAFRGERICYGRERGAARSRKHSDTSSWSTSALQRAYELNARYFQLASNGAGARCVIASPEHAIPGDSDCRISDASARREVSDVRI